MSSTTANANTTPTETPTITPVERLLDSSLSAETVEEGLGGSSLCEMVIDPKEMVVVDGKETIMGCSVIFTIAIIMMEVNNILIIKLI